MQRTQPTTRITAPLKASRDRHLGSLASRRMSSGVLSVLNRPLAGRLILLVEDEPLVAIELDSALRASGARVVSAGYVEAGLFTTEHPDLSAAIIDLHLGDGSGLTVCRRLRHLRVPFLVYTGYPRMLIAPEWSDVPVISKPARSQEIITQLVQMLA